MFLLEKTSDVEKKYKNLKWGALSTYFIAGAVYLYVLFVFQDLTSFKVRALAWISIVAPLPFLVYYPKISTWMNSRKALKKLSIGVGDNALPESSKVIITGEKEMGVFIEEKSYTKNGELVFSTGSIQREPLMEEIKNLKDMYFENLLSSAISLKEFKKFKMFILVSPFIGILLKELFFDETPFNSFTWSKLGVLFLLIFISLLILYVALDVSLLISKLKAPNVEININQDKTFTVTQTDMEELVVKNFKTKGFTATKEYHSIDGSIIYEISRNGNHIEYCLIPIN